MKYFNQPFVPFYALSVMYIKTSNRLTHGHHVLEDMRMLLKDAMLLNGNGKVANEIKEIFSHVQDKMNNTRMYDTAHLESIVHQALCSINDLIRRISDYQVIHEVNNLIYEVSEEKFVNLYVPSYKQAIQHQKEMNALLDEIEYTLSK